MTIDDARKAQVGDKIRYRSTEETMGGTVTEVKTDRMTIMWDDGLSCAVSFARRECKAHLSEMEFYRWDGSSDRRAAAPASATETGLGSSHRGSAVH
jgi:hypothetical protein